MLRVTQIDELGVRGILVEYDTLEAYARVQDMKRARSVRSLNHITRVGKLETVEVTEVDGGHVSVSRNIVTAEEREEFDKTFSKAKQANSVLAYIASHFELPDLGDQLGWPDHAALRKLAEEKFASAPFLAEEVVVALVKECDKKLVDEDAITEVREQVDLMCTGPDGVLGVKAAIKAGLATHPSVKIYVERCPLFTVMCKTSDPAEGERRCKEALAAIKTELLKHEGGVFEVKRGRRAVTDASEIFRYSDSTHRTGHSGIAA